MRDELLARGRSFGWHLTRNGERLGDICVHGPRDEVRLDYRTRDHGGDWETMLHPVRLLRTRCHPGGERLWFRCPALKCRLLVAMLYGSKVFACRHCHQFACRSQCEQRFQRYQRCAEKIIARLGWASGEDMYLLGKPKGMHWQTYHRLIADLDRFEAASDAGLFDYIAAPKGDTQWD